MTTVANRSGNDALDRLGAKVVGRQRRRQARRERAHVADRVGIRVDAVDVAALAQQVDEVAAAAAARVEHAIARGDPAAQQLIEQIDVDVSEFALEVDRGVAAPQIAPPKADRQSYPQSRTSAARASR